MLQKDKALEYPERSLYHGRGKAGEGRGRGEKQGREVSGEGRGWEGERIKGRERREGKGKEEG